MARAGLGWMGSACSPGRGVGSRGGGHAGPHLVDGSGWFGAGWGLPAALDEGVGSWGGGHAGLHLVDGLGWFGARQGLPAALDEGWGHGEGVVQVCTPWMARAGSGLDRAQLQTCTEGKVTKSIYAPLHLNRSHYSAAVEKSRINIQKITKYLRLRKSLLIVINTWA